MPIRKSKNVKRGYVPLKLGGKSYTLRIGMNALAELDDVLGTEEAKALLSSPDNWGFKAIRAMMFVALRDGGHDDEIETLRDIGDLMELSDLDSCAKAIADAFAASNTGSTKPPKARKGKGGDDEPAPFRPSEAVEAGADSGDEG